MAPIILIWGIPFPDGIPLWGLPLIQTSSLRSFISFRCRKWQRNQAQWRKSSLHWPCILGKTSYRLSSEQV